MGESAQGLSGCVPAAEMRSLTALEQSRHTTR